MSWLLYGANGHTGSRIARAAARRGEQPVLAGRSAAKVIPLAEELGCDYAIVDLLDDRALRSTLAGVDVVAHCAGPFSATASRVVTACLQAGTHYLDITGEIDVFEAIYARSGEAAEAGVVLLPGSGFDVVPSDCVAARLHEAMPEASALDLAFRASGPVGPGTAKTALEGAGAGGKARVDGRIADVGLAHKQVLAEFPSGPRTVTSIPWGDLASAYRSTGIPNITTYTAVPGGAVLSRGQRYLGYLTPLLGKPAVQQAGRSLLERLMPQGGGAETTEPARGSCEVWGQVSDSGGQRLAASLTGPDAITLTVEAVLASVTRLGRGGITPGAHTPATAFGAGFAGELDGVATTGPERV
jgi:saccharopine dehydrogenase (NAD+, L-lysine-forming)